MGSPPPTLEAFRRDTLLKVEAVGRNLGPEDNWAQMLLMDTPDGYLIHPIPPMLQDEAGLRGVTALIGAAKARLVARIGTAWTLTGQANAYRQIEGLDPRPSEHPERVEAVVVYLAEPGDVEGWLAEITRGKGPPQLGEWRQNTRATGPIADSLRLGLGAILP